jgi:class 3 adenylate cyclase
VTFLFTDIEGSTERWERQPEAMRAALERHDALLRAAVLGQGGAVFKTVGDAFCAAFGTAGAAVAAALAAQRVLGAEDWGAFGEGFAPLRVRMALHTGEAQERDGDYFGAPVNRVARLQTAAGGGQVLLSAATERLVREALPAGAWLRDHGEHRLKDLRFTEHIFQLLGEGLAERPGALRTAPPLAVENPTGLELPPGGHAILGRMFGGYARAVLTGELAGGFSGSRVYKVLPYAEADRAELPAVVKLGPAGQVGREYEAYLRHIRGRLTGIPEVWGRPVVEERGHWAGIRYGLVGAGLFDIQSLRAYAAEARAEDLVHVLESRLLVHMGALWAHNRVERRAPAAAYDALLPANLVLEPDWAAGRAGSGSAAAEGGRDALDEDHATLLTPATAMSLTLAEGDRVLLSGWVVTELEPHLGAATVDLPGSAAALEAQEGLEARGASKVNVASAPRAYRIRLQPVPEAAGLHLGQTLAGPLPCHVRETRAGRLRREVAEAVGSGVDLSEARLRAPEAGGSGSAGAASGGGASSSTSGPMGAGTGAATGPLAVAGSLPNPLTALAAALGRERSLRLGTVHGDLNLENVLVDPEARTVHLIDFAQAREDLVLLDLLRLETEVITHLLPEAFAESGLGAPAAAGLMAALLREPGQDLGGGSLRKVQLMLVVLRRAAAGLLAQADDWGEYQVGLAACLLGASKYRNLPAAGRAMAFWAAAALLGQAEAGAGTSAAALEGAVAALMRRNPVLEAYRRGRIAEWTGPRWELDDRFVALSLLVDQGEDAAGDRWAAKGERYTSLEALLAGVDAPVLVLLGPPGCGKSTILRHLELSLSLQGLDDASVPYTFFIQLNQYQAARPGEALPAPGDWLAQRWAASRSRTRERRPSAGGRASPTCRRSTPGRPAGPRWTSCWRKAGCCCSWTPSTRCLRRAGRQDRRAWCACGRTGWCSWRRSGRATAWSSAAGRSTTRPRSRRRP